MSTKRLSDRALLALAKRRGFTKEAVQFLFRAKQLLVLALAKVIAEMRETSDPVRCLLSQVKELDLRVLELQETIRLLQDRLSRIEARHRSHYTPSERFDVLVHKETFSLTIEEAARRFLVSPQTILRWLKEAISDPTRKTIGSLLKAVPPLRSYRAVTRELVCFLDRFGMGGSKRIAQMLARAGMKISVETVRRWRKLPRPPRPLPKTGVFRPIRARYPNHIWTMDLTEIPSLFRLFSFKLAVVLDVFSRFPLAARVFDKEPNAHELAALVREAIRSHGRPKYFVTDKGGQFTAVAFRRMLARRGIVQRYGDIGRMAVIERFWRTLKGMLWLRAWPPLTRADLEGRLERGLVYYALFKPHQGLHGATPAEVYLALTPAHTHAKPPPRERDDERSPEPRFVVAYLDPERRLPVLVKQQAA